MRLAVVVTLLISQFMFARVAFAQQDDANAATAFCDFEDGREVSIRYNSSVSSGKDEPHNGKVWLPGGSPITLFTDTPVTLNDSLIPVGAYSVYVIPTKKDWTLIVNKNVTAGAPYDEKDDVARGPMEMGEVDSPPKQLQASFAHSAPKVCSIRLYYGKVGAFVEFKEK
ncbi:MAG: DUF2911 domain-containing protein [Terriglobales bacterium]